MAEAEVRTAKVHLFGSTLRRDAWWLELLPVQIVLGGFGVYATLRAFEGRFYEWGSVPFSLLFSADRSAPSLVATFSCAADSGWPARFSRDLLLLSQSVLPRLLSRSAWVRGRRRKTQLHG